MWKIVARKLVGFSVQGAPDFLAVLERHDRSLHLAPGGGKLTLTTRISSGYSVKTQTSSRPRQDFIIEITDTGAGISEDHLKNLFTPFHTTKSKGSGLGLPISLKIVEDHQGSIKVSSQKGKGTTMQVYLPVQQGQL